MDTEILKELERRNAINKIVVILAIPAVVSFGSLNTQAQISQPEQTQINKLMPQPVPKSPNVASLGKFGDYPVSYFSGLPDISIPIFEVKSGSLTFPISLSYHASGIKPTDRASWVGMGWALAGNQVSRSVQGKPDEQGFYTSTLVQNPAPCTNYGYLKPAALGQIDTEPDVFSYSFPGGGGKFLLNQGGNPPLLIPYAPVVVNTTFVNNNSFSKFEITDEHGVLHRFGTSSSGAVSQEFSNTTNGGAQGVNAATAWHLMESIAPNSNDQITYTYQNVGTAYLYDVSYTIIVQDYCSTSCPPDQDPSTCPKCPSPYMTEQTVPSNTYVNQQGLSTITFKTGKVEFVLGGLRTDQNQLQSLDHINIYSLVNGNYILIKTAKFIYSYYAVGQTTGPLKLDELQFLDNTGALIEQYRFTYFTNSFSWDANFMNERDLWGYFNGATQNTDLILPTTIPFQQNSGGTPSTLTIGGAVDRTVHAQYALEGTLSRIDFPTGGYTTFSYESNQYDNAGTATLAGGLRVTQIVSSDGTSAPPKIKTYKYGSGESGKGVANFTPTIFNYASSQAMNGIPCQLSAPSMTYNSRSFYSNSAFAYDSYPVMYPYVTEYDGDPSVGTIGKVIYEFDGGLPPADIPQFIPYSSKNYRDNFSWKRGKMTHTTTYDNANNKIAETSMVYGGPTVDNPIGLGAYVYVGYMMQASSICTPGNCTDEAGDLINPNELSFGSFSQGSGSWQEVQLNEYAYENGNTAKYVMKQTVKTYDPVKFQLTQTTINRSSGTEQSVIVNQYPFQLSANSSSTGAAQGIYMLNQKNIVSSPVETYTYLQNSDGSNQRIVSGEVTTYRQNASNTSYVVPDQIYLWESAAPVAKSSYVPVVVNGGNNGVTMDANQKPRINIVNYDNNGNVQEVSKTNDVLISYKYGYNNALPVVEIKNAQNSIYQTTTTNVQSTGVAGITMGASGTTITQSFPFTVDYTGTVYLKLGAASTSASYSGITSGNVSLASGCGATVVTFSNVAPGNYTISVTLTSGGPTVGACGEIDYPHYTTVTNTYGTIEFYYEGFEESTVSGVLNNQALAHAGSQYFNGSFPVPYTLPNGRTYLIEYWYYANSQWNYNTKAYTGPTTLTDGTAFDDIRIYPTDAQMKSYNYDPVLGIRAVIDESRRTYLYDYDTFGRLWRIRNDHGGIEKQYAYTYKGN